MISRKQKFISMLFILTGMIGLFFLFYHVIKFEHVAMEDIDMYYPMNTTNNISGWNSFSYFTFISNGLADIYLISIGLAKLKVKYVNKIAYNPYVQGIVTVNMLVTGIVYCTILLPKVLLYPWNGPMFFCNIVNFWNHMIMPVFMLILWLFPFTNKSLNRNFIGISLIFPLVYLGFSIIRGKIISWYPYPFLNPVQLWDSLIKNIPFSETKAIILFISFILMLALLFAIIAMLLKIIRKRRIEKQFIYLYYINRRNYE